jgi:hypothetical protein
MPGRGECSNCNAVEDSTLEDRDRGEQSGCKLARYRRAEIVPRGDQAA